MLQNLGDILKSHGWLKYLLLGLLIVVFALWGAYGLVDVTVGSPSYGLKVNGEEIPATTLQQSWQERLSQMQQQFKGELPPALRERLQEQFINENVRETLLRQRARAEGFRVGDEAVINAYQGEKAFQVDGKFSKEAAQAVLAQVGLSAAAYEQQLRESLQIAQLQRSVALGDFVTEGEFKRAAALENEQREVRYVLLPAARYAAAAQVDDARVKAWYDAHAADYMTRESVRLQYAELRLDAIAAALPTTDAELKAWYEVNQAKYVEAEKRRARHILVAVQAGAAGAAGAAADAAAQKKVQQVLAELKAGGDFSALAKKYSDDPGSARMGGDLGYALRSAYVKEFADKLFTLKVGEVSEPVKTQFGYHIIKLDDVQGGKALTLADNRTRIEADYRRDRAADLYGDRQERLQQKLEAGSADFAALVQEFGLVTGEVPDYSKGNGGALGNNADLSAIVFSDRVIKDQRIGGPVALGDDRMVIVKALEHRLPKPRPVAEVRADIEAGIRKEEGTRAARAAADAAVKRLVAGESLEVVAKALNATPTPAALIGRGDPQPLAQVREAAFAAPVPAPGKATYEAIALDEGGGAAVLAVLSVKPGVLGANPTNDQRLMSSVNQQQTNADLAAYLAEVERKAKINKNPAIFQ
jgi:peptidyl-prolyl cis-trans isomerase D